MRWMGRSCPQAVLGGLDEGLGLGLFGGGGGGGADDVGVVEAPLDGEGGGVVGASGVGARAGAIALLGEGGEQRGGGRIGWRRRVDGGVDSGRRRRGRAIGGRRGAAGGQAEQGQRGAGDHSSVISFSLPFSRSSIEAT